MQPLQKHLYQQPLCTSVEENSWTHKEVSEDMVDRMSSSAYHNVHIMTLCVYWTYVAPPGYCSMCHPPTHSYHGFVCWLTWHTFTCSVEKQRGEIVLASGLMCMLESQFFYHPPFYYLGRFYFWFCGGSDIILIKLTADLSLNIWSLCNYSLNVCQLVCCGSLVNSRHSSPPCPC